MLRITDAVQITDTGRQREANEDSLLRPRAGLRRRRRDGRRPGGRGRVADGGRGVRGARRRSTTRRPRSSCATPSRTPTSGSSSSPRGTASRSGMGTTLTAALVHGDEISFGHVGDSRAYLYRDGKLKQITNDHSLVEELRRQGRLTRDQAAEHPQRSVITRALGPEPQVEVDTMTFRAQPGDVFLLCSDGLTTMLSDEDLQADPRAARPTSSAPRAGWSRRPTTAAAATTSPSSCSASRAPTRRPSPDRGGDADRRRAPRRRASPPTRSARAPPRTRAAGAPRATPSTATAQRPPPLAAGGCCEAAIAALLVLALLGVRRGDRGASGLVPRHRRRRPHRALPRPALRAAVRDRALLASRSRCRSRCRRFPRTAARSSPTTSCAPRTTPSPSSRTSRTPPRRRRRRSARPADRMPPAGRAAGGRRPDGRRSGRSGRRRAATVERAQPRALRPRPGRGAADLRLRAGVRRARRRGREPLADLRRLLLRDLPRRARLPALPAARTPTRTCSRSSRCWPRSAW